MLSEFIEDNRDEIIARARARVMSRRSPPGAQTEIEVVTIFLRQLQQLLRATITQAESESARGAIEDTAGAFGRELRESGLTVAQVVHGYGDVCQVVAQLAVERGALIPADEWGTFNACLDTAIAGGAMEHARAREKEIRDRGTERLGVLAHELRNHIATAILSFDTMRSGSVGVGGSVGTIHARSLLALRDLVDRSMTEVRLDTKMIRRLPISVAAIIEDAEVAAAMEARAKQVELIVAPVSRDVMVAADPQVLGSALTNLLQNAIKFTHARGNVTLSTETTQTTVSIRVDDQCGGVSEAQTAHLFQPFAQGGDDRTGLGLGLTIAIRAARANGGEIHFTNSPGTGCRFAIELPRVHTGER